MIKHLALLLATIAISAIAAPIESHEDLQFAKIGERVLKLDLYRQPTAKSVPGVVLVHGGGWAKGTKESFRRMAKHLAEAGYVTITIEYRLSGEAQFPGAVEDCKAAVRWLRANADKYGVDPERIAGIGGSAGGHLTGMVATTPGKFEGTAGNADQSSALQAAVLMGAGVDQVKRNKETEKPIQNCLVFFGGTIEKYPERYAAGSPITHISKSTPPLLFLDGEKDRPGVRYVDMRKQLDALGVKNKLAVVPGAKHGQWNKSPFFEGFTKEILAFLRDTVGQ
jgi:pectinesterase